MNIFKRKNITWWIIEGVLMMKSAKPMGTKELNLGTVIWSTQQRMMQMHLAMMVLVQSTKWVCCHKMSLAEFNKISFSYLINDAKLDLNDKIILFYFVLIIWIWSLVVSSPPNPDPDPDPKPCTVTVDQLYGWTGPDPALYRSFDDSNCYILMEGSDLKPQTAFRAVGQVINWNKTI